MHRILATGFCVRFDLAGKLLVSNWISGAGVDLNRGNVGKGVDLNGADSVDGRCF